MNVHEIRGKVDFAIITVREDEFRAVLDHFPPQDQVTGGGRRHSVTRVPVSPSQSYLVTVTRCVEQGAGEGQQTAQMTIDDLDPQWLMVVGITGAVPSDEYTLGDVIAPIRMHDFCVTADIEGALEEYAVAGGPMHVDVQNFLANLPARDADLKGWNDENKIGFPCPAISLDTALFYGDREWQKATRTTLAGHFAPNGTRREPKYVVGCIASSNRLVKSTSTIRAWTRYARHLLAVEMELAGIYRAARQPDREYPILVIRGISDIIGYNRDAKWIAYACRSAAAFARAAIGLMPIKPRMDGGGDGVDRPEIIELLFRYLEDACDEDNLAKVCLILKIHKGNILVEKQTHERHAANLVEYLKSRKGTVKSLVDYAVRDLQQRRHPLYTEFRDAL